MRDATCVRLQADLEVAVAGLARSSMNLTHALSSNKRLLSWKVSACHHGRRSCAVMEDKRLLPTNKHTWCRAR